jgi:hypothetical protein
MVVAPKTLCLQWVNAIECAWQEVCLPPCENRHNRLTFV